jgi:hypothetical protein
MLEMEVEDVLTFRTNLSEASEIVIGKNRVFWARPGALGRRHAVRVEAFIEPEQTSPVELTSDSIAESDDASQPEGEVIEENNSEDHFGVRR